MLELNSYRSLCTEVYELDKPTAPANALAFYREYAKEAAGPILEPMCGSGRYLVPLAEEGFEIDGVDASPEMLAVCREKCTARGLKSELIQGFLQDVKLDSRYRLAMIPAGSFTLITDPDHARQSLAILFDHLLPGSKLVLEAGQKRGVESSSWPWGGRWWTRPDGGKIILSWLGKYDATTGVISSIHRYELVIDGQIVKTEIEEFNTREYHRAEMVELLESAGFTDIKVHRAHEFAEPGENDEEVVYECTRP